MNNSRSALRLNVGFITKLSVGSSREFLFDFPYIHLHPDLDLNNLSGITQVTRTPQGLLVKTHLRANLGAECVRCLNEFEQPLTVDFTELYTFSSQVLSDTDLILPEDGNIDLEPLVREYMLLEVPINPICSSNCKGICPVCGERLTGKMHDHYVEAIDPRLAVLKNLIDEE